MVSGEFAVEGVSTNDKLVEGPDGNEWVTLSAGPTTSPGSPRAGEVTEFDLEAASRRGSRSPPARSGSPATVASPASKRKIRRDERSDRNSRRQRRQPIVLGPDGKLWVAAQWRLVQISPTNPSEHESFRSLGLEPEGHRRRRLAAGIASFGSENVVTATPTDPGDERSQSRRRAAGRRGGWRPDRLHAADIDRRKSAFSTRPRSAAEAGSAGQRPVRDRLRQDGATGRRRGTATACCGSHRRRSAISKASRRLAADQIARPRRHLWVVLSLTESGRVSGVEAPRRRAGLGRDGSAGSGSQPSHPAPETEILSGPARRSPPPARRSASPSASLAAAGSRFECRLVRPAKKKPKHKGKGKAMLGARAAAFGACSSPRGLQARRPAATASKCAPCSTESPTRPGEAVLPRRLARSTSGHAAASRRRAGSAASLGLAAGEREGPAHRGPGQALPDRGGGAARGLARHRAGRVLRPARPQRRRQVDADPLHDRAGAADLGARSRSSATTRSTTTARRGRRSGWRRRSSTSTGS